MAVITAKELVTYTDKAVDENWDYVWGANGTDVTGDGEEDADCSGLIVGAMRSKKPNYADRRANTFFEQCTEKGTINTLPETPGALLWKPGHIGVYRGNGEGNEARGRAYGAVRTKVKSRPWTHWGKHPDIDYSESEDEIMIRAGQKDGDKPGAVYLFQHACKKAGRKVLQDGKTWADMALKDADGHPVINGCDGVMGSWMQGVATAIQAKYGLTQTGEVDALTYGYLVTEIPVEDKAALNDLNAALNAAKARIAAAQAALA